MRDATAARRIRLRRNIVAMSHARRKLTVDQVREFKRWAIAEPAGNLTEKARELGVWPSTLQSILAGHTWRGVKP